jgi:tRNA dimethylallyltransferase
MNQQPRPKDLPMVLVIMGPTASGKSALALAYAQYKKQCEIISMDSALVYKHMNVGTAKPSPQERALVPHHLIDLIEPTQSYSAAQFVADANRAIAQCHNNQHKALLVGGTMLYAKALLEGLHEVPASPPAIRAQVAQQAAMLGWPALHKSLAQIDPTTAARLALNDAQRISRALEVWHATGKPLSSYYTQAAPKAAFFEWQLISLEPSDRAVLHQRINQRFAAMLSNGLIDEVKSLMATGGLSAQLPAMRAVGYRQVWEGLIQGLDLSAIQEQGAAATRQLAKRQLTWLRAQPNRIVLDANLPTGALLEQLISMEKDQ